MTSDCAFVRLPNMKKQVTFAESETIHRLHQHEAFPRSFGTNESKTAFKDGNINFNNGLKISRQPAARHDPQLQQVATIQIPKSMAAAPFLKHTALTPAQKEYLYTVAASYSAAHVRNLITQHYMNVLHRCVRAGHDPERPDPFVNLSMTGESEKHQPEAPSKAKQKMMNTRNPGKSFLPKIPNKQTRHSNTSASKQGRTRKRASASPTVRRKSPRRHKIKLLEEEEEDEGLEDSLSDCLSLLSLGEWDDDTFTDL